MACEIIGAKMLAPYFGTSLYVWAAALGITLGGLMVGYFLGGIVSRRVPDNLRMLYIILIAAAAFLFLMPFTSPWVMNAALGMSLQWGAVLWPVGLFLQLRKSTGRLLGTRCQRVFYMAQWGIFQRELYVNVCTACSRCHSRE